MKLLIAVPSKGRPEQIQKYTLSWLKFSKYPYKIFVEPQELSLYGENTISIEQSDQGLGYAKEFIHKYAVENGYDVIFKVDDDVMGWCGASRGGSKRGVEGAVLFDETIDDCLEEFEKHESIKAIGFPYRFQMFETSKWTGVNQRLQSCYIVRTDSLYPDRRISVFEDFHTFISIRVNGGNTLRYGWAGQDIQDVGSNNGGHQLFDRRERALQEAKLLRQVLPSLQFRKVDRAWGFEPDMRNKVLTGKKL